MAFSPRKPDVQNDGHEPKIQDVVVVGAGIAGLAVANALRLKGINVTVYERASQLDRQRGAGTGLSPNGQRCLHALGFSHEMVLDVSTPIREHILCNEDRVLVRSDYPWRLYEKYQMPITGTLRGGLVNMMAEPLRKSKSLHCGEAVTNVEERPGTGKIIVTLASGKTHETDLVVGADGIHSTLAPLVLGKEMDPPTYTGSSIFFGVIDDFQKGPQSLPPADTTLLAGLIDHPAAIVQVLGPIKLFLVAGGAGSEKKLVWKLSYHTKTPPMRKEWALAEGAVRKEVQAYLDERKNSGAKVATISVIQDLLDRTSDARLLHFGLFSRKEKAYWHKDRLVIIGDAAHATLPHVGQGANMALEDAVVLADALEAHDFRHVEAALSSFYARRRERTKRIVESSRVMGWFLDARTPVGVWLRNAVLVGAMRMDWYLKFAEKEVIGGFVLGRDDAKGD
ncbi:hypothetical protein NSK_002706 [Nannochloropsis salina CCMP1776]|jgi:salicylate hydroxylase|uniref:FAD-binding domain-containing protein n=1 Tax=Nannochloropsis salina CCMP1776 TaxID=1027361 RepID=A0A4D9D3A8_9STRA|nr:hypothetical protein NSK_002706 [Nannochloropsis salina CCMP1776]|eukprot:TFJ85886.1 hypothetical protein NSK_002706 [Nannochloropsis salina CCMP1776]